jgi:REP element-mobilizing transposase RayT
MSYVKLLYHIVIRTKASQPVLSLEHSVDLYTYIWGIIKNKNCELYRINGTEDHVHLLVSIHQSIALAKFVQEVKAGSSMMLKRTVGFEKFTAWSVGYAALTTDMINIGVIINYIKNQREHHKKISFKDEFTGLIERAGMEWDERDWTR